jgi:hypothetical protein
MMAWEIGRIPISEDKISLEFLTARIGALTDRMHDFQLRFASLEARFSVFEARFSAFVTAMEARFDGIEGRFAVQEERTSRMLAILCGWLSARGCRQKAAGNES